MISLKQAAQWCRGTVLPEYEDVVFSGARADSRLVEPGHLFVALQGARDGHDFIPMAMEKGAAAALGERQLPGVPMIVVKNSLRALGDIARGYRGTLPDRLRVVGVTGSVGKTTTKEMIACALSTVLRTRKTEKNYNNDIGLPMTVLDLQSDTEAAVIEMGMNHFGELFKFTHIACIFFIDIRCDIRHCFGDTFLVAVIEIILCLVNILHRLCTGFFQLFEIFLICRYIILFGNFL